MKPENNLKFFNDILDALPEIVWLKDANGIYLNCNREFTKMVDLHREQIIGRTDYDIFPVKKADIYRANDRKAVAEGAPITFRESMEYVASGCDICLETTRTPLYDCHEELTGILGVAREIRENRDVFQESPGNQEFLNLVMDRSPLPMWIGSADGTTLRANQALYTALNLTPEQIVGKYNLLQDDNLKRADIAKKIDLIFDEKQSVKFDLEWKIDRVGDVDLSGGRDLYIDVTIFPLLNQNGEITHIFVQWMDISERKRAEEALSKSEGYLSNAVEMAKLGYWELDIDSGIFTFSDSFYSIFKTNAKKIGGYKMSIPEYANRFVHPEDQYTVANESRKAIETNDPNYTRYLEHRILFEDGSIGYIAVKFFIVKDKEGRTIKTYGVNQDITETKRLQELESRAERLETAGTIAGQVAHDFNNLMAPITAYPEIIRDELPENHPALEYIDQIEKAAKKIADINQQLLTLSRRGHYNQEVLNLNTIVEQSVKDILGLAGNINIETILDPELMKILGGESQIHRLITNLLYNAVDAVGDDGQISIKTENYYADDVIGTYGRVPMGEYVKLTITDNGCGISDDIVQKIFDPFFTTKTSDKKRGSGLGMSVVDAVIKDHKGYLDLKTQPGEGTSFYLYFPITRMISDKNQTDEIKGGNETILIVDDDDIQRDVSTQLLKRMGYRVNAVESGEKAIEFLRSQPHDLVILDMVMPGGIDGAETFKQIITINPNQKAIIVSGFSESDRVRVALDLGAGAYARKPLTRRAIAVAVRTELDKEEKIKLNSI